MPRPDAERHREKVPSKFCKPFEKISKGSANLQDQDSLETFAALGRKSLHQALRGQEREADENMK